MRKVEAVDAGLTANAGAYYKEMLRVASGKQMLPSTGFKYF